MWRVVTVLALTLSINLFAPVDPPAGDPRLDFSDTPTKTPQEFSQRQKSLQGRRLLCWRNIAAFVAGVAAGDQVFFDGWVLRTAVVSTEDYIRSKSPALTEHKVAIDNGEDILLNQRTTSIGLIRQGELRDLILSILNKIKNSRAGREFFYDEICDAVKKDPSFARTVSDKGIPTGSFGEFDKWLGDDNNLFYGPRARSASITARKWLTLADVLELLFRREINLRPRETLTDWYMRLIVCMAIGTRSVPKILEKIEHQYIDVLDALKVILTPEEKVDFFFSSKTDSEYKKILQSHLFDLIIYFDKDRTIPIILERLKEKPELMKEFSRFANFLGALKEDTAPLVSDELLTDRNPKVRELGCKILGIQGDINIVEPVQKLLTNPDKEVRLAAFDALVKIGLDAPKVISSLRAFIEKEAPDKKESFLEGLILKGSSDARAEVLREFYECEDFSWQSWILQKILLKNPEDFEIDLSYVKRFVQKHKNVFEMNCLLDVIERITKAIETRRRLRLPGGIEVGGNGVPNFPRVIYYY